jgi:outer membrane biosynthesis protein TonB
MAELPADTGSLLTQKAGPLPMWGWGVVVLGAAYGYKLYKDHKGAAAVTTTPAAGYTSANLPSNIQPQYTAVDESYTNLVDSPITTVGRQYNSDMSTGVSGTALPPIVITPAPVPTPHPTPTPKPPTPVSTPVPRPVPVPVPTPKPPTPVVAPVVAPPAPQGKYVTVVKWNPAQRNAPSTLSGLALQAYGNAAAWPKIWNAPQNASLVARRGSPTKIHPGDKFFAPA